jgi:hypothetical protein
MFSSVMVSAVADGVLTDYGRNRSSEHEGLWGAPRIQLPAYNITARQLVPEMGGNGRAPLRTAHRNALHTRYP